MRRCAAQKARAAPLTRRQPSEIRGCQVRECSRRDEKAAVVSIWSGAIAGYGLR